LFVNSPVLIGVEIKPHARDEVHAGIDRITAEECAGTDREKCRPSVVTASRMFVVVLDFRLLPIVMEFPPGIINSLYAFSRVSVMALSCDEFDVE
jgi:hypothetical protein